MLHISPSFRGTARGLGLLLLLAGAGSALAGEPPQAGADPADPWVLAESAVATHPSIEALEHRRTALAAATTAARSWADPVLGFELSNLPVTAPLLEAHPMAGVQLSLVQRLLAPGKGASREALSEARVDVASTQLVAAQHALRGEVVRRAWDLASLRALAEVADQHGTLTDAMLEAATARYVVGGVEQHELLALELRRDRLLENAEDLRARARAVESGLQGALGIRPDAPSSTLPSPRLGSLPPLTAGLVATLAELADLHPSARIARARAAEALADAERARAETLPDPSVSLGYRVRAPQANADPGTNFVSLGLKVPLPVGSSRRWRAAAASATSTAKSADADAAAAVLRATAASEAATTKHARARARLDRLEALVGIAADTLDSARLAYANGRATFSDLLRAEAALLDLRIARIRAITEGQQAAAVLHTLVGLVPEEVR